MKLTRTFIGTLCGLALVAMSSPGLSADPEAGLRIEQEPGVNPWNHLDFNNPADKFSFAIVSDLTGRLRPNVFPDVVRKLNLLQPEFVVTIGDLIEGHTNDAAQLNREWDAFFKAVEPLEMPIFYTPGNHDYWYETTQGAAGRHEVYDMAEVYRARVGRPFYDFIYKDVLFLILNNNLPEGGAEVAAQERYIAKTLAENDDVRWTFVFFHYSRGFQGRREQVWQYLAPLLEGRRFTVFSGNSHQYVKYDHNGMDLINLGTTGGMSGMRGPEYGEFDHLAWVTVKGNAGPRIVNLELDGIHDKNVRTLASKTVMSLLLAQGPVSSEPVFVEGGKLTRAATDLRLVNGAELPLRVRGRFRPHAGVTPLPGIIDVEVAPGSSRDVAVQLRAGNPVPAADVGALEMEWVATYSLPGDDPDVEVSGVHRLVVDVSGDRPGADWTLVDERFDRRLDPAWVPLGPGGSFTEAGNFMLADDAPALAGERKDAEGRYTDGPLFEIAVHSEAPERDYRYTDGRGIYTMTPLFHLPTNGIYRDLPAGSFEAELEITNIDWSGDGPALHWEFWDEPDRLYNYGPSWLSGVIVKLSRDAGGHYLKLSTASRLNLADLRAKSRREQIEYRYTDTDVEDVAEIRLERAPSELSLRAQWRESTREWAFYYGIDGSPPSPMTGGEFVQDVRPSPEGKRNLIYVPQAKKDGSLDDPKGGFSVVLERYRVAQ